MNDWNALYTRFLEKRCTAEEVRQLLDHFKLEGSESALAARIHAELANDDLPRTDSPEAEAAYRRVLQQLKAEISDEPAGRQPTTRRFRWLPYVAAAMLIAVAGSWFFRSKEGGNAPQLVDASAIKPGGNKATLTLADGRVVDLNPEQAGITVGDSLRYDDGSLLAIEPKRPDEAPPKQYAMLTTPKGGMYSITLADGTTVWLNSASTLKYPLVFDGAERVVELTGEAYFDVQRQQVPFLVKTESQTIEVLGTQFNVCAYPDENGIQTTLVTGSVQVSAASDTPPLRLSSGEQSTLSAAGLKKAKVDVSPFVAWKDGLFSFSETELRVAMNQLSRWYDVEVVYEGDIPPTHYFGDINRREPLANVLELLKASGLHFKVERIGDTNRLVVMP